MEKDGKNYIHHHFYISNTNQMLFSENLFFLNLNITWYVLTINYFSPATCSRVLLPSPIDQ